MLVLCETSRYLRSPHCAAAAEAQAAAEKWLSTACIIGAHSLQSLAALLLLWTAVRSRLSGFYVSEEVTCYLSLCAWSVSFTTYGHLQLQLWHKCHNFFLFYEWIASLCVHVWYFLIHWGGRDSWVSLPFVASVSTAALRMEVWLSHDTAFICFDCICRVGLLGSETVLFLFCFEEAPYTFPPSLVY